MLLYDGACEQQQRIAEKKFRRQYNRDKSDMYECFWRRASSASSTFRKRKTLFLTVSVIVFVILDSQPPSFGVSCLVSPLVAYAERDKFSAVVDWAKPDATDNSGIQPTVTSNYQSPQLFGQGAHVVRYTAVDQSGNKATCTFTVKVIGNRVLAST